MDLSRDFAIYLFAAISIGYGTYSYIKGEITYGPEGGGVEDERTLSGTKAKIVSALLVISGGVLLIDTTVGLYMVVGVVCLPWLLGD